MKDGERVEQELARDALVDLATELCIILLSCDRLRRDGGAASSQEQSEQIDKIEHSARKIHRLTREILGPTRKESFFIIS